MCFDLFAEYVLLTETEKFYSESLWLFDVYWLLSVSLFINYDICSTSGNWRNNRQLFQRLLPSISDLRHCPIYLIGWRYPNYIIWSLLLQFGYFDVSSKYAAKTSPLYIKPFSLKNYSYEIFSLHFFLVRVPVMYANLVITHCFFRSTIFSPSNVYCLYTSVYLHDYCGMQNYSQ